MTEQTRSNSHPLVGQVVLVTGASSGLGRATALALAQAGAAVGLLARSTDDLAQVVAEAESAGRRSLALPLDLAQADQILDAVQRAVDTFRRIDVLSSHGN